MTTLLDKLEATISADVWPADPATCVDWQHGKTGSGYGMVQVDGRGLGVHRVAYCFGKQIPLEAIHAWYILHSCDNPACFRVSHLRLGTHAENMGDKADRDRCRSWNAEKTHCDRGHEFNEANTIVRPSGDRDCRTCQNRRNRESRARRTPEQIEASNDRQRARRAKKREEL